MYIIGIIILVLVLAVWASADVGSGVYLKTFCKGKTDRKLAALTFDDGPADGTEKVLDILDNHGIKACFFLIGSNLAGREAIVWRMVESGHIVAGHSWSHNNAFPFKSMPEMKEELAKTAGEIAKITGKHPKLFRPPFGVTNPNVGEATRALGLSAIGWSIRSYDTVEKTSRRKVADRIIKRLKPGCVILLHDRCRDSDILLEMVIKGAVEKGYEFVTPEKLFDVEIYGN